ncbi:YkgJ family cysteine cluster protein [Roseibium aestuarii]|uniref:YkgJ family cysteine cluster protein n=1 Tax=Roseibium aestuarii TaxID=2600299 RepID=A0ABW4JVA1_9HYPH|nr:YkgJ family cysteine cluster protein [Roseibium aestuarii]
MSDTPASAAGQARPATQPQGATVDFACVGCGRCCTGHHVPLTLSEARDWCRDGGEIIILIEALLPEQVAALPGAEAEHVLARCGRAKSGGTRIRVAATFAAWNPGLCRNLDESFRCRIYERRPMVCRIYPMETNPHLPLRSERKDCPPEAWGKASAATPTTPSPLLRAGRVVDPDLAAVIERSRLTDYAEAQSRVALCEALGMTTAALRGDGFTTWRPERLRLLTLLDDVVDAGSRTKGDGDNGIGDTAPTNNWDFAAASVAVAQAIADQGADLTGAARSGAFAFVATTRAPPAATG